MRGAGRVVFAAVLLLIVGTLNIIYGIGALDDANIFVNDQRYILTNLNTMGWVLIVLGLIQLAGGFSLMAGNTFGRARDHRRQPRGDRGPAVDRRQLPVVVARHLLPVRGSSTASSCSAATRGTRERELQLDRTTATSERPGER